MGLLGHLLSDLTFIAAIVAAVASVESFVVATSFAGTLVIVAQGLNGPYPSYLVVGSPCLA